MKKIISLILTVAMLMSVATFVAPVSAEQTREEFLNAPAAEYLNIPFNTDGFATVADIYKYYPRDNGATNFPSKDVDGNPITNHVNGNYKTKSRAGIVYLIDSILGNTEGKYSGYYLNESDVKTAHSYTFKINGNNKFSLQSTETDGTMNFLYNHNNINFKMGPIGGIGAHLTGTDGYNIQILPDQVGTYTAEGTIENPTSVSVLMTTWTVNGGGYAGFFPIKVTYADGSSLTKYALSVDDNPANDNFVTITGGASSKTGDADRVAKTIVYVPKTTDISTGANIKAAEKYLSESTSQEIIGKAITINDVKFPNDDLIIKGESVLFGDSNIARNASAGFGNGRRYCAVGYVDYINIPVTKQVASVQMAREISAALNWKDENGDAVAIKDSNVAYIPVTIEGASEDYLYFAKLGRLCKDEQAVFAATISGQSLQEEIDAIETRIEALDKPYNSEQKDEIAKIMSDIGALKVKGVLEDDFDDALITKLNDLYAEAEAEIKKARIEEFENKIDALADKYSNTMKSTVEAVIAEREALLTSGFISNDFDSALFTKLTKLEEVYTFANNIETKVNGWGNEYLYTMYNDVKKVKEDADGLKENEYAAQDALSSATTTKIEKMNSLAKEASAIDDSISALADEYTEAILEDLEGIKASMDTFKTNGGTDNGIIPENLEKFNKLYDDAQADIEVKAKEKAIADFKESVDALGEKYTADKKDALENAIEKYDAAIALGVTETELGASLAKYNELCEIYKLAVKLEEAVSKWPAKYSISYYDEVISKKAEYDSFVEMEEAQAISEKTVEKINSFYNVASKAAKIDEEIAKLPEEYETSVLATLKKLNQEIEALYEEGASEGAFANISKFNSLYANVEEANKFLYERTQQFVSLEGVANIDLFASWKDITNYARFLYNAKGSNAYVVGDLTSTHTLANGSIINLCIPTTTYEGMEIKGNAAYYKKGINIPAMQMVSNIFVLDDLLEKNGTVVKGYRYNTANVTSTDAAGGSVVRTVAEKTVKSGHVVNVLESGKYAIVENNGTQTKVGPLSKTADTIAYNAIYLSGGSVTAPVGLKGKILSCMLITNNINTQFTYADCVTQKNPVAGVQNMEISYKDGSTVKKFAIIKKASTSDGIIWYAPKKDKWTADDLYGAKRVDTVKQLTAENINEHGVELSDIKPEDFTFEDENVVMAAQAELASLVGARQETMTTAYNNAANLVSIPVEEKEIASLKLDKVYDYRTMAIKGSIVIEGTGTRQAFIPVEIKGANEEYDYFVFVGGLTNDTYLAGITVEGESIMDTIVETEEMISELSDEFNEKEIEKLGEIKSNIDALAAKGVSEYDYDADLYEKFNQIYTSPEAKEAIDAYVYNNPQIVSVEKYTDLDNMTYTVKFSAPITQASVTKELFSVTKNGEGFSGYEVNAVKTEEQIYAVEVIIPNDYNYSDVYSLTVSKKVMGMGNSLKEGYTGEYDAPQAVQAEVTYADGEGMVVLTNNMNYEQVVTAVVAVYGSDNQMSKRYVVSEKLAKGESIEQAIAFDLEEGQKVECLVLDNFANSRKVYNTYIFE